MYTGNGTKAQKFIFKEVKQTTTPSQPTIEGKKTIEDGIYKIYSKVANNRLLEVPNKETANQVNLKTATNNNQANQKFRVTYQNDGTYAITFLHSGKSIDIKGGMNKSGTLIQQYDYNGSQAQRWIISENTDKKTYTILSKASGLVLDIVAGNTGVGANIQLYSSNGSNAQKFVFEKCEAEKGTQSAEDGTYRIFSVANTKKLFDIEGGSIANGAKVQMWDNAMVTQQKFDIEYVGDGYYKIKSKKSNKVLTVASGNPSIGSQISQQEDRNLDTQKWILKRQSEGVYSILSKCGNLYIDLGGNTAQNGQKLQLRAETDLAQQRFILVNETPNKDIAQMDDGVYQIQLQSGKVLDVAGGSYNNSANIQIWANDRVQQQKFHITRVANTNYYKIVAVNSAKALDVQGGLSDLGTNIDQYNQNGTANQSWLLKNCGNGYYNIISKANGLCLDVAAGNMNSNGANIQLYYGNGSAAQKFKLVPINIINNNTYEIETKLDTNKVLDVAGASKSDKANVQLWTADNVDQQKFIFEALTTDTYKIIAKHSGKALTLDTNSNNVCQDTYRGTNNQVWKVQEAGGGYYNLIAKSNGFVLDVSTGSANDGQNMQGYTLNNSNAQKFRFVTGVRKFYEEGTYGTSGLRIAGDGRGSSLKYYKYGKGAKHAFLTFSIHGFEDSYNYDGAELTYIAEEFKKYIDTHIDGAMIRDWTIYIFPCLNPDGQKHGWTNNGPGRNTLFSAAPANKGIDMNRNWSVGYKRETGERNYNGTEPFQAYEARALRDFILSHQGSKNILVDTHGWLNETIGDNELGYYYRAQFGLPSHINSYGSGYLVNWARTLNNGRSVLVELPEVKSHSQTVSRGYAQKYINATMQMLREN